VVSKRIETVSTLGSFQRERDVELGNSYGTMEKNSKDNGRMGRRMDLEYGNLPKVTFTKDNGGKIGNMARGTTSIMAVPNIEATSKIS
jgi:hypothetical protein